MCVHIIVYNTHTIEHRTVCFLTSSLLICCLLEVSGNIFDL